ncbi:WD40-repeat-containing domain protein [Suillus clintonianus]|uniref:WD40-repeat-containing domain protein n=1 Tax=Suillus clintonianus TaxID=1904413 RepID=UPI001B8816AB|nr:WD40-repeat-containing domain protein [Suillus clintonianus]KAG2144341.1 WD40-repeat-containing domain protein [Suillus clintonianus]
MTLDERVGSFMPIVSPPTPAPSPRPSFPSPFYPDSSTRNTSPSPYDPSIPSEFSNLTGNPASRKQYLVSILHECSPAELRFISQTITPMLKRDVLTELPAELALHILAYVDDPRTLARASQVCKRWHDLVSDDWLWKVLCDTYSFRADTEDKTGTKVLEDDESWDEMDKFGSNPIDPWLTARDRLKRQEPSVSHWGPYSSDELLLPRTQFSHQEYFRRAYGTMLNLRKGGSILRAHRMPIPTPDSGVITSVALDTEWVVVGLANSKIHMFSAITGVLSRTLVGHEQGVWAVNLVCRGGYWGRGEMDEDGYPDDADDPVVPAGLKTALGIDRPRRMRRPASVGGDSSKPSDICCTSEGWGQPNSIIVSASCDKTLRVWDARSGHCIYVLRGHTATVRCARVLHNRPIAVTGSRDSTLRVWNIQKGVMLRVLHGHTASVRCLDVCGNKVVSGSYDTTCRIWDVDTGECLRVLRGHSHQIYSIAIDGNLVASGGMDTIVRVWDATTGNCVAQLTGHTALVCQLQLSTTTSLLATGGSDGRVITFSLRSFSALQRLAAHDSSVTSLQFDANFLITGGNDGRVRVFETQNGMYVRDLSERCESVWKVAYKKGTCAIMCKRAGKTVIEIWTFKPKER